MRRSAAPSFKHAGDNLRTKNDSSLESHSGMALQNASRDTDSILDLITSPKEILYEEGNSCTLDLGDMKKSISQDQGLTSGITLQSEATKKRIFNVLWGKQSTRKHKKWEGDGVLEVEEKTAVLKDTEGKILGRSSGIKQTILEDGSRLLVGGKEVEIVSLVLDSAEITPTCKRPADDELFKKPSKKPTSTYLSPCLAKNQRQFQSQYKQLIMPNPPSEHRWEMNPEHLPLVEVKVDPCLVRVLRQHQRAGVVFLYECVLGMRKPNYLGAILADEMGLGKTLQCVTLVWTLLKQGPYGGKPVIRSVLIISPSSLVCNWQKEFQKWLGKDKIHTFVVDQKNKPRDFKKLQTTPVMLISYEMMSRYINDIKSIDFDLLICDEGHRLKNSNIKISLNLSQFTCRRRVLLTGTPVQNDLQELYALVNFVNPGVLGTILEFKKQYEEPIVASRQSEADEETLKLGKERAAELNCKTGWFILRRTQDIIDKFLPMKYEFVIFCRNSPLQNLLYRETVDYWITMKEHIICSDVVPHLSIITILKKICNHPVLIKTGALEDALGQKLLQLLPITDSEILSVENSGKLSVLSHLLQKLASTKERVVLVSYYTQTLNLFAQFCENRGYKYCRLDGSTTSAQRQSIVNNFNNSYSKYFVFLLSARAGGVGLNLTGASRLILFDSDWNPASDLQAMSRIWRDGQSRPVFIYRFLSVGTIEEKIFQRQISKTGISGAVVDPQSNSSIRLNAEDLKDLMTYNEDETCLTHKLLECKCEGNGTIPEYLDSVTDVRDERPCQLGSFHLQGSSLRMNQLFHWEHHSPPYTPGSLKDSGLEEIGSKMTFIFKTSTLCK